MKTIGVKLLTLLLTLVLAGALVPVSAFALEDEGIVGSDDESSALNANTTLDTEDRLLSNNDLSDLSGSEGQTIEPLSTATVSYYDPLANQDKQVVATKMTTTKTWNAGWYYVDSAKEVHPTGDHVDVKGHVNLILTDGCEYEIDHSIVVPQGSSLTIWGQQQGTGLLDINGMSGAGIGSKGTVRDSEYIRNGYMKHHGAITINGGTIKGVGGEGYPAIGGNGSEGEPITINHGTVKVTGGIGSAGIGGGNELTGPTGGYSNGPADIIINGGSVTATAGSKTGGLLNYGYGGAGIGGGAAAGGANVVINGGTITASGKGGGAGIGTSSFWRDGAWGAIVTINGGTVVAKCTGVTTVGDFGGAGIGGGHGYGGGKITITGGDVTAVGLKFAAGIGGSNGKSGTTISISGGTVTATGGLYSAGIGGGPEQRATINISGGSVYATGGEEAPGIGNGRGDSYGSTINISGTANVVAIGTKGGAGIGSCPRGGYRYGGGRGEITISDGTVYATTAGHTRPEEAGAAIGAGAQNNNNKDYCKVNITGGTIVAEGNGYGAAIGGGYNGAGINVSIAGGDITAITGNGAAAIGGGEKSLAGLIDIHGGDISIEGTSPKLFALGDGKDWQSGNNNTITDNHPSALTIGGDTTIVAANSNPQGGTSTHANKVVLNDNIYLRNLGLTVGDDNDGTLTITGGNVDAITSVKAGAYPINSWNEQVYRLKVNGNPAFDNGAVVSANVGTGANRYTYNSTVNTSYDNTAYLWLSQAEDAVVTAQGYLTGRMPISSTQANNLTLQAESSLSIKGIVEYGETLELDFGEGAGVLGCQWYRITADGTMTAVGSKNSYTYKLGQQDVGCRILCRALYENDVTQDTKALLVQRRTVVPLGVTGSIEKVYDGTRFMKDAVTIEVNTDTLPDEGKDAYIRAYVRFNDAAVGENKPVSLFAHTLQGVDTKLFRLPSVLPESATKASGTITPCSLTGADIVLDGSGHYPYTDEPIEPTVLSVSINGNYVAPDQYAVTYATPDHTSAGEKQLTITAVAGGNYKDSATTTYTIDKIDPEVVSPYPSDEPLNAIFGQTLSELDPLPSGFKWECEPDTTSAGTVGLNVFTASYTPEDIANYNVVTGIEIFVLVTADGANLTKVVALAEGIADAAKYESPGLAELEDAIANGKSVLAHINEARPEDVSNAITWIAQALKDMGFSQKVSYGFKDDKSTFYYEDTTGLTHFTQKDVALHSGEVYVDETLLTQGDDYILDHPTSSGNTTITLTPAYLDSLDAGFHDLRVKFIDQKHSTSEFEVARIPVVITPVDKTVTYDPAGFDIEELGLFSIDEHAGAATYRITSGTGKGALNGTHLTVDASGTFHIMVATEESGHYAAGLARATLTVEKADPVVPEVGTLQATIGKKLSYLNQFLPEGYTWDDDPYTTFVGFIGLNIFTATYTPPDPLNYNTVAGVEIFVEVTANDVILSELTEYAELLEERMIYETEALANYREAIANAQSVLAHREATQKDVDDAIAWLLTALTDMGFYQDVDYAFKDNKNTYQIASKGTLIHITQKDLALHNGDLYVDEKRLREGVDYHPESGSAQITLTTEYLESLTPGIYNLRVGFIDGKHSLDTFTVIAADKPMPPEDDPTPPEDDPTPPDNKTQTEGTIPAMGDFGLSALAVSGIGAILALCILTHRIRRRREVKHR